MQAPTPAAIEVLTDHMVTVGEDGRITDNYVMVDFPHVLAQLGVDCFDGEGWEKYDRGEETPPAP